MISKTNLSLHICVGVVGVPLPLHTSEFDGVGVDSSSNQECVSALTEYKRNSVVQELFYNYY